MVLENLHETVARPHAIALKLRPNRGPAQGVWSHAPARHYLWCGQTSFSPEKLTHVG